MAERCQRCGEVVYQTERVGPVNGVVFHRQCFLCNVCRQHLTLRTYFTNQSDRADKEIYCNSHCPRAALHGYDASALFLKAGIKTPANKYGMAYTDQVRGGAGVPKIDFNALHISEPVLAQSRLANRQQPKLSKYQYPAYFISRTKRLLYKKQQDLEALQRIEEDRLMESFQAERQQHTERIEREVEEEWERQLKILTDRHTDNQKSQKRDRATSTSEGYEREKEELKKTLTIKMQKQREMLSVKLEKEQQDQTTDLVKKHGEQMMDLIKSQQKELKQELRHEMSTEMESSRDEFGDDLDSDSMLEEVLAALMLPAEVPDPHPPRGRKRDFYHDPAVFDDLDDHVIQVADREHATFTDLVQDLTDVCITDLQKARAIFRWITLKDLNAMKFDETVVDKDTPMGLLRGIKYGTETYHTLFLRLCSYAGLPCSVIKGHSKSVGYQPGMKIKPDTFLNSWNVVLINGDWWPVQCNWGARHLVLNKDAGSSKASISRASDARKRPGKDKIKYQYDEHYFLTDPDEFIQEFLADDPEWQLLDVPLTLEQFEELPFVRSIFFQYGLEFERGARAVIVADESGGAEVKVKAPQELINHLVFHYQLRYADRDRTMETEFNGVKLERFVFHTVNPSGLVHFSVHLPSTGAYYIEIFTNRIDDVNRLGDDPDATIVPLRLKCSAKFKIVCAEQTSSMLPLPDCASGEWGPWKAHRHFGMEPVSHQGGIVSTDGRPTDIKFKTQRGLTIQCKLRSSNSADSKAMMQQWIKCKISGGELIITLTVGNPGQYGLDIYAKPKEAADNASYAHACKYLVNCVQIKSDSPANNNGVLAPSSYLSAKEEIQSSPSGRDKIRARHGDVLLGPTPDLQRYRLQVISPLEFCLEKLTLETIPVVVKVAENVDLFGSLACQAGYSVDGSVSKATSHKGTSSVAAVKDSEKIKFLVNPSQWGVYLFQISAQASKESSSCVVFNYIFNFIPPAPGKTDSQRKKGSLFKR